MCVETITVAEIALNQTLLSTGNLYALRPAYNVPTRDEAKVCVVVIMANAAPVGADPAVNGENLSDADGVSEVGVDQLPFFSVSF